MRTRVVVFLCGCLVGYLFSYYMLSKSVSYKVEQAYELGFNFGTYSTLESIENEMKTNLNLESNPYIKINQDSLSK